MEILLEVVREGAEVVKDEQEQYHEHNVFDAYPWESIAELEGEGKDRRCNLGFNSWNLLITHPSQSWNVSPVTPRNHDYCGHVRSAITSRYGR